MALLKQLMGLDWLMKKSRVAVALSGGIDSGIAASILKEQGLETVGVFMRLNPDFKGAEEKRKELPRY